jgi:5-aminopentanamidase
MDALLLSTSDTTIKERPMNERENNLTQRIVRVSAVQLPAVVESNSVEEKENVNLGLVRTMLTTAGERKSDLVLFGEYANLYHRSASTDKKDYQAKDIPDEMTSEVMRIARRYTMNVVLPVFGRYKGSVSSHSLLIDRSGSLIGYYQKAHVTEQEQRFGMIPGDSLPVFQLDCCTVGIMTCMDIEYPEVAQILMLGGAEILLFPHVQASWGESDWEIRYRARAIDTGLYLVSACYGYADGEWIPGKMIGRSGVVGRDGLIIADAGRRIDVVTTDIDIAARRLTDFYFSRKLDRTRAITASRRPELYAKLVDSTTKDVTLKNH